MISFGPITFTHWLVLIYVIGMIGAWLVLEYGSGRLSGSPFSTPPHHPVGHALAILFWPLLCLVSIAILVLGWLTGRR